jgi:hypothetical protein
MWCSGCKSRRPPIEKDPSLACWVCALALAGARHDVAVLDAVPRRLAKLPACHRKPPAAHRNLRHDVGSFRWRGGSLQRLTEASGGAPEVSEGPPKVAGEPVEASDGVSKLPVAHRDFQRAVGASDGSPETSDRPPEASDGSADFPVSHRQDPMARRRLPTARWRLPMSRRRLPRAAGLFQWLFGSSGEPLKVPMSRRKLGMSKKGSVLGARSLNPALRITAHQCQEPAEGSRRTALAGRRGSQPVSLFGRGTAVRPSASPSAS